MDIEISNNIKKKSLWLPRWCVWLIYVVKEGLKIEHHSFLSR